MFRETTQTRWVLANKENFADVESTTPHASKGSAEYRLENMRRDNFPGAEELVVVKMTTVTTYEED